MEKIISYILSPPFIIWLFILKILFLILSLFFLGVVIFVLIKTTWIRRIIFWDAQEFLTYRSYGVRKIAKQWLKIRARLDTGMESEFKLAAIEAD